MEIPARRSLAWRQVLDSEGALPPHLKLSPRDTRGLIQTLVAIDTIDCADQTALVYEEDGVRISLIEQPDFPLITYHELLAFTEEERYIIRRDLQRVLVPTNKDGRLDVFLPIDILVATLGNVGKKTLFTDPGEIHQSNDLLNVLPEWRINHQVTEQLGTYNLCVELAAWLSNPSARHKLTQALAKRRTQVLQTFNNRRPSRTRPLTQEIIFDATTLPDPKLWN